ncbi:MAG: hypothetical protein WC626_08295 [Methanoregula sp.]
MDSDFFKEYDAREYDALERSIGLDKRVGQLKPPISYVVPDRHDLIWSQIAFSGTLIFPLYPYPTSFFGGGGKNSTKEISDLIQFVKETKKIQFVLTHSPSEYESLEYLEPILKEFLPPTCTRVESKDFFDLKKKCEDEINLLTQFSPDYKRWIRSPSGRYCHISDIRSYAVLRHLGFNDIADTYIEHFLTDPEFSGDYIQTAYNLLCHPIIDPLKANPSFSSDTIQRARDYSLTTHSSLKRLVYPEIGSYLMKKCTYYPESLEACKRLIDQYKENDLYDVYSALNNAVIARNESIILEKKDAMNDILDNIWEDRTIKRFATGIRGSIDITCGTVGYCLGSPSLGLLAALGLRVVDGGKYIDQFSELISKKIAFPYMATIYDFKKEYRIKK